MPGWISAAELLCSDVSCHAVICVQCVMYQQGISTKQYVLLAAASIVFEWCGFAHAIGRTNALTQMFPHINCGHAARHIVSYCVLQACAMHKVVSPVAAAKLASGNNINVCIIEMASAALLTHWRK